MVLNTRSNVDNTGSASRNTTHAKTQRYCCFASASAGRTEPNAMRSIGVWICVSVLLLAGSTVVQGAEDALWPTYSTGPARTTGPLQTEVDLALVTDHLPEYGDSFKQLTVQVTPETPSRLHVKISPAGVARWEVPEKVVPRPGALGGLSDAALAYTVQQPAGVPGEPFALTVNRRSNQQPIFDTSGHRFIFKDQYIELSTRLPRDANIYGLGEVSLPTGLQLPRDGTTITLWARDMPSANPYANLYGSHPFYLQLNADGSAHGVLLLNSNGMDVILNQRSLTYKVIGGLVDLYFFTGPTPEEVIRQYHELIGKPAMPPYWSLGLHQSRWGWKDVESLDQVVQNYTAAGLPLEVVWSDIEYMPKFWTMEFDPVRYPVSKMQEFVGRLHASGQRWIPITDAGVAAAEGYGAYERGLAMDVFVKDHNGQPYMGQVWPGQAVFPDYMFNPATYSWLKEHLAAWHQAVPFDGLWLDMNEPASFCEGMACEADPTNQTAWHWLTVPPPLDFDISELIPQRTSCQMKCRRASRSRSSLDSPPYRIHNWLTPTENTATIDWKTMSATAVRHGGVREYDSHNLFGTAMAHDHYRAVKSITGKRPFLLSRSTFPGAGRYAAHWTGDNAATWSSLHFSIAGIINTNFWGISMAGADICGFFDIEEGQIADGMIRIRSSEINYRELCNRWASAGAFYPFSRNHYTYFARPHEYYRWPDVAESAKKAYGLRYRLLTYIYSNLYLAHTRGGPVAKPVLFTDPADVKARNATEQWLLGESVLVSPVIKSDTYSIKPYFTAGAWYNAWNYTRLDSSGQFIRHSVPMGDIAVHYRGGSIIPMQPYANLTKIVRYTPITLVVTLPAHPSGTPGAPLPPYHTEEACAAVHAAHPGQLVSCGVLFMDTPDDTDITPGNSVEVWYTAVTDASGRSGRLAASVRANAASVGQTLRLGALHILGVAADHEVAKQLQHQDDVLDVVSETFLRPAADANMRRGRTVYDAQTYDLVTSAIDEASRMDDAPPHATVNGAKLPAAWVKYSHTMRVIQITGLDLPVGAPTEVTWSLD